jgi:polyvinyl alcohol dehydrogenase (cytochrome)
MYPTMPLRSTRVLMLVSFVALSCVSARAQTPPPAASWSDSIICDADKRAVDVARSVVSLGFGVDRNQTRSLTAAQSGLTANDLTRLDVAWAIGFPGGNATGAAILGDTVFIAGGGRLAALDAASGCVKWSVSANSRNTPSVGDLNGKKVVAVSVGNDVLVVDAKTGATIWQASGQSTDNPGATRGGVVIYKDKIIVPISASGVVAGQRATFECCVGHGAVVALAAADGKKVWEYHTMRNAEYTGQVSSTGVKQRGPSGAPIWAMPLVDEKRHRLIIATGENTSHPGTETSDAIIAIDLNTGRPVWTFQAMSADVWNMACGANKQTSGPNCPWNVADDPGVGRDFDFGAGAILAKAGGRDVILAGQKSGDTWALDAQTGKKLWNVRFGQGTALGGVHWGITTDGQRLFAPINDPVIPGSATPHPGIYAVDINTGKQVWGFDAKPNCEGDRAKLVSRCTSNYGFSAAPLTIDGAVVGGTLGGEVIILDGKTGKVLKTLDTIGMHKTINGIDGKGGSIESHGISAGAGMLFINSGYGLFGETGGNVLIAYKPVK